MKPRSRERQPLTEENIVSVLPASAYDVLWALGVPEDESQAERKKLIPRLRDMERRGLIFGRSRTADDPVYYRKG